ncbi:MAG TPA: extracellular solute-binding protein [Anaerolineales bacterium]|nr:extracellular solute-binding protein [Anaerolineales bacterium]
MSRIFRFVVSLGLLFSAGCASIEPLLASLTPPTPVPPTQRVTPTPAPTVTATTPPRPATPVLRLWLPPQFDPAAENEPAKLLRERLAKFQAEHEGLKIEVRVKKSDAENDIISALSLTNAAAPSALPDLIMLSRPELEVAAMRGLLHPIDGLSTSLEGPNWYGYAQQLGRIQNTGYGLPFAGNAMILVYYPELGQVVNWDDVLSSRGQLVFPAGNPQALVGLSLYASAGGKLVDAQGLPALDVETLTKVLAFVKEGVSKDVFPPSLANVSTEAQALQIYRTGDANKGVMWILDYRSSEDGEFTPLPGLGDAPFSYATGWLWALAGSNAENQQLAVKLAEYLVADEFISEWTQAAGYLPMRPSAVQESDRTLAAVMESAHPLPSNSVLAVLGPLMQDALTRVLNGEEPAVVAASTVQKLK